ncbi:putative carbonic anhydrase 3 [Panulirus ornatus]|uniref:putative carbonic anhydrase 3 n=1 Tax=Panulirus ornatus TaxID=150431 RepID=UPI003A8B1C55
MSTLDLIPFISSTEAMKPPKWSYHGETGPDHWAENFPLCRGTRQSPVDLAMENVVNQTYYEPFRFFNYDKLPSNMTVVNNGHTIIVLLEMGNRPTVSGGGLGHEYELVQMHFHWGRDFSRGSEHKFGNRSYSAELHLVHYNLYYGSIEEAVRYSDGLAVLGICMDVMYTDNPNLNNIISALDYIYKADTQISIQPFPISQLMPNDMRLFFRYAGSLTTPPCSEVVVWTVFEKPIVVSHYQLAKFRTLWDDEGMPLVDNFRPLQAGNGRQVQYVHIN